MVAESPSVWLAQVVARALLETAISGGVQNDDLCNKKDEFCTKSDEFCILKTWACNTPSLPPPTPGHKNMGNLHHNLISKDISERLRVFLGPSLAADVDQEGGASAVTSGDF